MQRLKFRKLRNCNQLRSDWYKAQDDDNRGDRENRAITHYRSVAIIGGLAPGSL